MDRDIFQQRYLEHIERKKLLSQRQQGIRPGKNVPALALDALASRHSQRTFSDVALQEHEKRMLYEAVQFAPSSCNRQAICIQVAEQPERRQVLEQCIVGGRNWIGSAPTALLLFADMRAYKNPAERDFMPWLDAAFVAANVCFAALALGLGACYVNPNIRERDRALFDSVFNDADLLFCGAVAVGNYQAADEPAPKRALERIFYPGG